ncbi:MAG: hypothetical protein Q9181_000857 [Wetmoreana brouardii]
MQSSFETILFSIFVSALLSLISGLALSVFVITYRLFFHPLAKFPGPKLAAATKWYEFYFDILKGHGGQFAEEIRKMHQIYGPIIRINPDELHVEDPDWYDTLYANNPTKRNKWPPAAAMAGTPLATFGAVEHSLHGKRRAALSPLFSSRSIADAGQILQKHIEILSRNFEDHLASGAIVELRTAFVAFTTDVSYTFGMGESLGLQHDTHRAEEWYQALKGVAPMTPLAKQFPWMLSLGQKLPLDLIRMDAYTKASQYLKDIAKDSTGKSPRGPSPKNVDRPVFRSILESALPAHEKSVDRLAQEGFSVVTAGGETTARVLALGIFYIVSNPTILRRLRKEVDVVIPDASRVPSVKVLEELPYLTNVVKEILRMSAIVTSRLPLAAPNELKYKDWVIPPKTPVGMTPHDVLHDPSVFAKPEKFDPDRWSREPHLDRYLVAFGKGTRMCLGMRFAWAELNMAFATLFRRFNLELYDTTKERDVDFVGDCFLGEHNPDSPGIRSSLAVLIEALRPILERTVASFEKPFTDYDPGQLSYCRWKQQEESSRGSQPIPSRLSLLREHVSTNPPESRAFSTRERDIVYSGQSTESYRLHRQRTNWRIRTHCRLRNGAGPTVLLRGDMDALPVMERTGLDYASKKTVKDANGNLVPVMHACGHDVHISCLTAAAELLYAAKSAWKGTLICLFQPAEELVAGAQAMVDDGLYTEYRLPKPDIVLGQHVFCIYKAGMVALSPGGILAEVDGLRIRVFGKGGHGALPSDCIDPIVIASHIVVRLQTIASRELEPGKIGVITVGKFQAGTASNIIPDHADLELTIRSFDSAIQKQLIDAIERIARADEDETKVLKSSFSKYFQDYAIPMDPFPGSEDFSVLARAINVPYIFWGLGGCDPVKWDEMKKNGKIGEIPINHSSGFTPMIEPTLRTGVDALALAALTFLG